MIQFIGNAVWTINEANLNYWKNKLIKTKILYLTIILKELKCFRWATIGPPRQSPLIGLHRPLPPHLPNPVATNGVALPTNGKLVFNWGTGLCVFPRNSSMTPQQCRNGVELVWKIKNCLINYYVKINKYDGCQAVVFFIIIIEIVYYDVCFCNIGTILLFNIG